MRFSLPPQWSRQVASRLPATRVGQLAVAAGIVVLLGSGVVIFGLLQTSTQERVENIAQETAQTCADATHRPTCYEEELPKYMNKGVSMEDTFEAARVLQRIDPQFVYCHVLGHKLAAVETAKDPSQWKVVAARVPVGVCSYGGIHGAFQERFRSEWLEPAQYDSFIAEVADACTPRAGWQPTGVEQASCMHAMGHLTMFVANGEVSEALSLCKSIVERARARNSLPLCFDGVFMQVFQPLEPEDFALVDSFRPQDQAAAKAFCANHTGAAFSSCTSERWPYFVEPLDTSARAIDEYCSVSPTHTDRQFCFMKMVNLMTARNQFSPEKMIQYCEPLSPSWQKTSCIVNATSRMLENDLDHADRALRMCAGTTDKATADACYQQLSYMIPYSIPNDSPQFEELCVALPPPYDGQCLANTGSTY